MKFTIFLFILGIVIFFGMVKLYEWSDTAHRQTGIDACKEKNAYAVKFLDGRYRYYVCITQDGRIIQ